MMSLLSNIGSLREKLTLNNNNMPSVCLANGAMFVANPLSTQGTASPQAHHT